MVLKSHFSEPAEIPLDNQQLESRDVEKFVVEGCLNSLWMLKELFSGHVFNP